MATGLVVHNLSALVRDNILLPCDLMSNNTAENMTVTWKLNSTDRQVHRYKGGRDMNDRQCPDYKGRTTLSKLDLNTGNASLKLANVTMADGVEYICSIQIGNGSEQVKALVKVEGKEQYRIHSLTFTVFNWL